MSEVEGQLIDGNGAPVAAQSPGFGNQGTNRIDEYDAESGRQMILPIHECDRADGLIAYAGGTFQIGDVDAIVGREQIEVAVGVGHQQIIGGNIEVNGLDARFG